MTRRAWMLLTVVLVVTAAVFAPAVGYEFVYDDHPQIVQNPRITDPIALLRGFTENVWAFAPESARSLYYRPLFTAWLTVQRMVFGLEPAAWHASSIGLHLAATGMLFAFLLRLFGSAGLAAAATTLWAVHPTRVESVAWVSGATDPLAALFGFGALLLWLDRREVLAVVAFAAALLCKETALGFGALPFLLAWFRARGEPDRLRGALRAVAPFAAVAVAYLGLRAVVLGSVAPTFTEADAGTTARTVVTLVGLYARKLLIPGTSSLLYPIGPVTSSSMAAFGEGLPWAVLAGATLAFILRGGRAPAALAVGGLVFLLPVLRVSGLQADAFFQDRYLYLPSACLIPAIAWTVADLFARMNPGEEPTEVQRMLPAGLAILLATVGLFGAVRNLPPWKDDQALWQRALEIDPRASRAWFNLGVLHENDDDLERAHHAYRRAADGSPPRAIGAFRAALLDAEAGRLDAAREGFRQAVAMRGDDPMFLYEAARLEAHLGAPETARVLLDAAADQLEAGVVAGRGVTLETVQALRRSLSPHREAIASPP